LAESDEEKPGVILDYDDQGDLVSLEILDASRRVTEGRKVEFQMAESLGRRCGGIGFSFARGCRWYSSVSLA
jgi:hypothetical protein